MANQVFGQGVGGALGAQQQKQAASMAASTDYADAKEEIRRYSLGIRPRALVYEVDGGYLVQMVPKFEGEFFNPPKICLTAQAVGDHLLQQAAVEALDR